MNVASLELCKQLYELSGWENAQFDWIEIPTWNHKFPKPPDQVVYNHICDTEHQKFICPAYDLGYLRETILYALSSGPYKEGEYEVLVARLASALVIGEDRTAKLAIELHKQGILPKSKELRIDDKQ